MGVGCLTSLPVWRVVVVIRPLISEHRGNSTPNALDALSSILFSARLLRPAVHLDLAQIVAHARYRLVGATQVTRLPSVAPYFTEERVDAPQLEFRLGIGDQGFKNILCHVQTLLSF
jgi:hypothetical protein